MTYCTTNLYSDSANESMKELSTETKSNQFNKPMTN